MDFSWLDKNLTRAKDENLRRKAIPKLKEIAQLLEETIQTVRHIATELRPGVLDTLGLSAAIDWQSREFARRSGIQCELQLCNEPKGLPPERATALFRIFQEILTNVARHSNARRFNVEMAQSDGNLILTVDDNGIGITEEQLRDPKSLGLIGMRERVLIFGGSVLIEGQRGGRMGGTTIKVKMPAAG
jgi:signal transduction histidine kinase